MYRFLALLSLVAAAASAQTTGYTVTTFAGVGRPTGDNAPAAAALLNSPVGLVSDTAGNLYFADQAAHRIRKIDASGRISTIAGTGTRGATGDGGPALQATLFDPAGVALDPSGVVYFTDTFTDVVRKIDVNGTISTVAGTGKTGYSGDGGPATAAQLNFPAAVAFFQGFLYIADTGNNRVRRVAPNGTITTVAGTGEDAGFRFGGPGATTPVSQPYGLAFDGAGTLYISEYGLDRVLKLDGQGNLTPIAGTGQTGESGDGGPAIQAMLNGPSGLTADPSGTVYVADQDGGRIRKISGGTITTVAGTGRYGFSGDGGAPSGAQFAFPYGIALDQASRLVIADTQNQRIRRIDFPNSLISTIAGSPGSLGDNGPATAALLFAPANIALDGAGNLFVADGANHRVRRIAPNGTITTAAGTGSGGFSGDGGDARSAQLLSPQGVAIDAAGNLIIADTGNQRIRRVNLSGTIQTVAGNGLRGFSGDGNAATLAMLRSPVAVAFDAQGNFYIADSSNNRIRKVTVVGQISTVAGSSTPSTIGDGGPATSGGLLLPLHIALDTPGNLYIADSLHNRIRKADTTGTITTIAGNGTLGFTGDGAPAAAATLALPGAVAVGSSGQVYFTDALNGRVRVIGTNGIVSTVAGAGGLGFTGDGGPALSAQLGYLAGIAVDSAGAIYVSDQDNHRIRKLSPVALVPDFTFTATSTILTLTSVNGFAGTVQLGVKNNAVPSATFAPVTLAANRTVTLPVPPLQTALTQVTLTADSGALHHEATISVTPQPAGPVLTAAGIANGASFTSGPIAPGEIITVYGTGFGPSTLAALALDASGKVATSLAGTSLTFNGRPAPLLYVAANQLSAIVPYGTTDPANVQITFNGVASSPVTVAVAPSAPGLFTTNSSGSGPAAALNQDGSVNTPANPAQKGSVLVLFGTGEGETDPIGTDGQLAAVPAPKPRLPVTVTIDGQPATVLYAGSVPGLVAGLLQINVTVPDAARPGAVPAVVTIGSQSSVKDKVTVSIQ